MSAVSLNVSFKLGKETLGIGAGAAGIGQVSPTEVAGGRGRVQGELFMEEIQVCLCVVIALSGVAESAVPDVTPAGCDGPLLLVVLPKTIGLRR